VRVLPVNPGTGIWRIGHGLCVSVLLFSLVACGALSPKKQSREEMLRDNLRGFHWALISQDAPGVLRYVPSDERDRWDEVFACLFRQLRLLDYRIELVKFAEESREASVRVRWTGHPFDSLVVREMPWKEKWAFDRKKQRWLLSAGVPEALQGLPKPCIHKEPEGGGE
jgi:hypothetical protein